MAKFYALAVSCLLAWTMASAAAAAEPVVIYYFYGEGCPYCAQAEAYLSTLRIQNDEVSVRYHEVWNNAGNAAIMRRTVTAFGGNADGVPRMVIGEQVISGFDIRTTPAAIEGAVATARTLSDPNPAEAVIADQPSSGNVAAPEEVAAVSDTGFLGVGIGLVSVLLVAAVGWTAWRAQLLKK